MLTTFPFCVVHFVNLRRAYNRLSTRSHADNPISQDLLALGFLRLSSLIHHASIGVGTDLSREADSELDRVRPLFAQLNLDKMFSRLLGVIKLSVISLYAGQGNESLVIVF